MQGSLPGFATLKRKLIGYQTAKSFAQNVFFLHAPLPPNNPECRRKWVWKMDGWMDGVLFTWLSCGGLSSSLGLSSGDSLCGSALSGGDCRGLTGRGSSQSRPALAVAAEGAGLGTQGGGGASLGGRAFRLLTGA